MKKLFYLIPFVLMLLQSMCDSPAQLPPPCADTLNIQSGQAHDVVAYHSKSGKLLGKFVFIKANDGKILAAKSKEGWQIVDCEGALEVLVADLELARQTKPN